MIHMTASQLATIDRTKPPSHLGTGTEDYVKPRRASRRAVGRHRNMFYRTGCWKWGDESVQISECGRTASRSRGRKTSTWLSGLCYVRSWSADRPDVSAEKRRGQDSLWSKCSHMGIRVEMWLTTVIDRDARGGDPSRMARRIPRSRPGQHMGKIRPSGSRLPRILRYTSAFWNSPRFPIIARRKDGQRSSSAGPHPL